MRRLGASALVVFLVVTAFSLIFNAVTRPPPILDPGFGRYAKVGRAAVHYQAWGHRGTPIVLVPGFLESSTVWSTVGPLLGEHHVVYAVDLPGTGYTRSTGPSLLHDEAAMVAGFLHTLHLRGVTLVGHSLGAAVIGSVALQDPSDIRKVIFADGDGLPINIGPRWFRSVILDSPYVTTLLRIGSRWTWADQRLIQSTCGPSCPPPSTASAEQWVRPLHQLSGERALRDLMRNADNGLTPQQISAISVPSAIIWGTGDHDGGSLHDTIVNLGHPLVHMIRNAGHLTMIANPKAFARAVEAP